MNGERAKELRKIVYGSDYSIRERKFEVYGITVRNVPGSRRSNYQLLKKVLYEKGIISLRKNSELYMIKEKPLLVSKAPIFIPISKYEFMDKAKLTLPQKSHFWLIRILRSAYYKLKNFMHSRAKEEVKREA